MIRLSELLNVFNISISGEQDTILSEATIDSRTVIPGGLFIAIKGERVDGHSYISHAVKNGALVALIEQDVDLDLPVIDVHAIDLNALIDIPQTPFCLKVENTIKAIQAIAKHHKQVVNPTIIGITGSVGKSSTKELVADVLNEKYHTHKNPGNYNNEIGLPLTLINCGYGQECVVLEMGFYYPGEIKFLCDIASPSIGIVTNIGTVHAERAGSKEKIAEGKSELVQALPKDGVAILNYDDPFVKNMAEKTPANVIFYGLSAEADIWADDIHGKGLRGIEFTMHHGKDSMRIQVPILGKHSVQTILRAAAAGLALDMSWEEIISGLKKGHSQLRLVAVRTESGALVLDDTYNATPESVIAALDLLDELKGNKVAVLGDMLELGQYEEIGHKQVGERAAEVANHLVTVGKLGRIIAETALDKGFPSDEITIVKDSAEAVDFLKYNLSAGDVVLIKGSHGLRMDKISSALEKQI